MINKKGFIKIIGIILLIAVITIPTVSAKKKKLIIGDDAFGGTSIETLVVPSGTTSIGKNAFKGNTELTEIVIPASVQTIDEGAFEGCPNLTKVTFEDGSQLTKISDSTFKNNTSLTTIEIPKSVTEIGNSAFENTGLKTVTFEDNSQLETIGESAFKDNTSLTTVEIPASVTTIEDSAFENTGLKTVTFEDNSQLETIGENAFKDNTSLTNIDIPDSVTSVGDYAFENTPKLNNTGISDTTEPTITTTNIITTTKSIKISFVATDSESGVKDVKCVYGETNSYGKNGTLSFRIPKTNPMFDYINLKKSIFRVYQVDIKDKKKIYTQIFRGMATTRDEDFYSRGQISCEGELAFFNDSIIRPYKYNGDVIDLFKKYVNEHNSKVDEQKKFYVRNCTVTDSNNYITRANNAREKVVSSKTNFDKIIGNAPSGSAI